MTKPLENISIILHRNGISTAPFSIADLHTHGLCIRSGPAAYPAYTPVELEFLDKGISSTVFPAIVTHCSREGMGIAIQGSGPRLQVEWMAVYNRLK